MGLGALPSAGGSGLSSMGGQKPGQSQSNPGYQYSLGSMGGAQVNTDPIAPSTPPVTSVGTGQDYMGRMQDAYYNQAVSRLDPQWNERQQGLESQLANMGLTRGSEAWNREMDNMSRQRNDAYSSATNNAILNSGTEAARLQGMNLASGSFANQAAQQGYQNQLTSQQAYNQAQAQQFGQGLSAAQLRNAAVSQQQGTDLGYAGLANQMGIAQGGWANQQALQSGQIASNEKMQGADIASKFGLQAGSIAGQKELQGADIANQQRMQQTNIEADRAAQAAGFANAQAMQQAGFGQQTAMQKTGIEADRAAQAAGFANAKEMQAAQFGQQTSMQQTGIAADQAAQAAGFANAKEMQAAQFGQQTSMQQTGIEADRAAQAAGFANAQAMQQAQFGQQTQMQQSQQQFEMAAQQAGFTNAQQMQQTALAAQQKLAEGQQLTQREIAAMNAAAQVSSAGIASAPGMMNAQTAADRSGYEIAKDQYLLPLEVQERLAAGTNPAELAAGGQAIGAPGSAQGLGTLAQGNQMATAGLAGAAGELANYFKGQKPPTSAMGGDYLDPRIVEDTNSYLGWGP